MRNSNFQRRLVGATFCLLLGFNFSLHSFGNTARAEQPSSSSGIKEKYLSLRNTDADVSRIEEWVALTESIETLLANKKLPATERAPLEFRLGVLHEQLYLKRGREQSRPAALLALAKSAEAFPEQPLAAIAAIKYADFLYFEEGKLEQARLWYNKLAKPSKNHGQSELARERLALLERGERRRPVRFSSQPSAVPAQSPNAKGNTLVILDPGHGGEDFGAIGQDGLYEKDVTLDIALRVERALQRRAGVSVRLTRRFDEFVPLAERTNIANDFEAALFISIHNNASPKKKLSGMEFYYLDTAGDEASKKLAERENFLVAEDAPSDLAFILSDVIQSSKLEDSIALATELERSLKLGLQRQRSELKSLGVKRGPFYVLVGAHMPCVLLELFFIDHVLDGRMLALPEFRQELAQGIVNGVFSFLKERKINKKLIANGIPPDGTSQ
jgi:N-acetylmuramoyl-L-alanine amidase